MRKLSQIFAVILITFFILGGKSFAQNNEQPLLVTSFNKVLMSDVSKVNKMLDSVFAPILNELVNEGFILGWGQFNHAWGDEWNLNIWYIAKDMASFDKFWDEYIKRGNERHPGSFAATTKYFQAHKDNIYTIRSQYPAPPAVK